MKTLKLLVAATLTLATTVAFSAEQTRSFFIDDSHESLSQNSNGYFEYDSDNFSESKISEFGHLETYRVGHPARHPIPGIATYYINDAQADHTYDLGFKWYAMDNRTTMATFTVHKLDGTTADFTFNMKSAGSQLMSATIATGIKGVYRVDLSSLADDQTTDNSTDWQNPGWVIADTLTVKEYAPEDTDPGNGGGTGTIGLCPVVDYEPDWSGLVAEAQGYHTGARTYMDVIGDVNGDGIDDLIAIDRYNGTRVLFMQPDKSFIEGAPLDYGYTAKWARKAGDFNKDGIPDIMVGTLGYINFISLNADGSLQKASQISPNMFGAAAPMPNYAEFGYDGVAFADADADGFMDTYLITAPKYKDAEGYLGVMLIQINTDGELDGNKFRWLKLDKLGGYVDTIDVGRQSTFVTTGTRHDVSSQRPFYDRTVRTSNMNLNLTGAHSSYRGVWTPALETVANLPDTSKIGYYADSVLLPGYGHFYSTYDGPTIIAVRSSNTKRIIAPGVNNMPVQLTDYEGRIISQRAHNLSALYNFNNSGETIIVAGTTNGFMLITLNTTQ